VFSLQVLILEKFVKYSWLIYVLVSVVVATCVFLVSRLAQLKEERTKLQRRVAENEQLVNNANQRLDLVFRLSQLIVDATEEREVVDQILKLSVELTSALGASLVPIDEHGQPMAAVNYGDLPTPVFNAWVEYLASPAIRHRCGNCSNHEKLMDVCPLLDTSFVEIMKPAPPVEIYCLPLRRGEYEYGVLNLYLPEGHALDKETQAFLRTMVDETALALEGVRINQREINALRQLQTVQRKSDLTDLLTSLIGDVKETLVADFALLEVPAVNKSSHPLSLTVGEVNSKDRIFIDGIIKTVMVAEEPVSLGDVTGEPDSAHNLRALLAAPLVTPDGESIGVITVGNINNKRFTKRQLTLLTTVAGQVALVVQNTKLMAELEYQTMVAERARLAREIHDGLAQTLGFLKLQTAQLKNYASHGEMESLQEGLNTCYGALVEAYEDARQTIDGLRIVPTDDGLASWLEQTAVEFQDSTGIKVYLEGMEEKSELVPEVQAQLIRIVQEALSNTRKHADAQQVWVSCSTRSSELVLEIRDDGRGFSPEDIPLPSRHGMRGMRERAELIGAEFQVISRPHEGAIVRLRLPMTIEEAGI
jgi:two-component system nitrate/nitrite sensor histidine kinase NarX